MQDSDSVSNENETNTVHVISRDIRPSRIKHHLENNHSPSVRQDSRQCVRENLLKSRADGTIADNISSIPDVLDSIQTSSHCLPCGWPERRESNHPDIVYSNSISTVNLQMALKRNDAENVQEVVKRDLSNGTSEKRISQSSSGMDSQNLSEKGQKFRARYSSSGYGTGSGESNNSNSASKSSQQLSQEPDDVLVSPALPPQRELQQHETWFCGGNDNTLAIVSQKPITIDRRTQSHHSSVTNDGPSLTEAPAALQPLSRTYSPNQSSGSTITNYRSISSEKRPQENEPQKTEHEVKFPDTFTSPPITSSSQLSSHDIHSKQQNSICESSMYISSSQESKISFDHNLSYVLQHGLLSDSSSLEEFRRELLESLMMKRQSNILQKPRNNVSDPADHLKTQSLPSEFCSLISSLVSNDYNMKMISRTMYCDDHDCDDVDCALSKQNILDLHRNNTDVAQLTNDQLQLLTLMCIHAEQCSLPKCPFGWCRDSLNTCPENVDDARKEMKQRVENYARNNLLNCSSVDNYMKLHSSLTYDTLPVEGEDWQALCMMGRFSKSLLGLPLPNDASDMSYWVIKRIPVSDSDSQWRLYAKLKDINHDSITKFLWIATSQEDSCLLACSVFEGFSLQECLMPEPVGFGLIINIMGQLTAATKYLHANLEVIYLNWTSKKILVTQHRGICPHVKLSDFSCAALKDNYTEDIGHLKLTLPRHIRMPELAEQNEIYPVSDVWGLGCLLHELVTGRPVWHALRHEPDRQFQDKVKASKTPELPSEHQELWPLFDLCWERDCQKRKGIKEMEELLVQLVVRNVKASSK